MKLYTVKVVAKYLDMTERNVRILRDKNIITESAPGLFDLARVIPQYIEYIRKGGTEEETADYNVERAKLVKAKRENEELELALKRKELHRTEDIEQVMTDTLIRFKTRLLAIPAKVSPILAKKTNQTEIFEIIKSATDEALEELADFDGIFGETNNAADTTEHKDTV